MTRLVVPILVQGREAALALAARAAERGADLVEYRIDTFTAAPAEVAALVEASPLPCILTCRREEEGGGYAGDEAARLAAYEAACAGPRPPAYLDVELAAYEHSAEVRQRLDRLADTAATAPGLILSTHDFDTRPADLYQRLEAMLAAPACRVVKLAWRARSLRDNLEAFELLLHRQKPTIALCMGEAGLPSRVLAKKFGALLTFAALEEGVGTAPGQPTVAQLKHLYRWDRLGPDTSVYGVIGHPVGHSLSPAIHNAGFDVTGFDGVYLPMPVLPEYESFKATVGAWLDLPALQFRGASVTIPHKENLLRFVRERHGEIEPLTELIGAANTLTVRADGSLYASNTDYAAALDAACAGLGILCDDLAGRHVAVLGAGGAARAIAAAFAQHEAAVTIYNRTAEKGRTLAAALNQALGGPRTPIAAKPLDEVRRDDAEVYINCTPIGMYPNVEATPLPQPPPWGPGTVVFDTIYNPAETRLLRDAKAAGCITVSGVEMFVRQAIGQFQLWTGKPAPRDVFERVVRERLG